MSDSFLDHLPSREREKIRKRLRSPEEYERLREKIKGPEDLEREMKKSEQMAEVKFRIETEPETMEKLHNRITDDLEKRGVEGVLEDHQLTPAARTAIEHGKFMVSVEAHPTTQEDSLVLLPEGNIQNKLPVKLAMSERYIQSLITSK